MAKMMLRSAAVPTEIVSVTESETTSLTKQPEKLPLWTEKIHTSRPNVEIVSRDEGVLMV